MGEPALDAWLALREPVDFQSRSRRLATAIGDRLPATADAPLRALDLGAGRGSNIRYLSGHWPAPQRWLALDREVAVLRAVAVERSGVTVETAEVDLGLLQHETAFRDRHVVTASALLDLVSREWLEWTAARCRDARALVLFALTYNGINICRPSDPDDAAVLRLFNEHQRRDKGLAGGAAGPAATEHAAAILLRHGYHVEIEPTDWRLGSAHGELQAQLIDGWACAATEIAPQRLAEIEAWRERRRAHVDAGRSEIIVGHHDLAAWL